MPNFKPYLNQDYQEIKANCLKSKKLFQDDLFTADDNSLFRIHKPNHKIHWKRPREIFSNPKFIINSIDPKNIIQGQIGNWYF